MKRRERDWASRFYLSYAFGICAGAVVGVVSGSSLAGGLTGAVAGTAALLVVRGLWVRRARSDAARVEERANELAENRQVGVEPHPVDPSDAQR